MAMEGCTFDFGTDLPRIEVKNNDARLKSVRNLGNLFSNEVVREYALMTNDEFKKMNCKFLVEFNPQTKEPHIEIIKMNKFTELPGTHIYKLAAKSAIDKI